MTRKDYILLAEALATVKPWIESPQTVKDACAHAIADALAADNPRFDRDRFLKDAGVAP